MAKEQAYNVRIIKKADGTFELGNFMHRLAERGKMREWVDASERDKTKLQEQLSKGT